MEKGKGKLKALMVDRVDLVDAGANPDAHITLFKRDDVEKKTLLEAMAEPRRKLYNLFDAFNSAFYETLWDETSYEDIETSAVQFVTATREIINSMNDVQKGGSKRMKMEDVLKNMPEEEQQVIKDTLDALRAKILELEKATPAPEPDPEEEINKAELPEAVRKQLESYEKRLAVAESVAKAEREQRLTAEFAKRAESYAAVGDVEVIAKALRAAFDTSDEHGEAVETLLKTAAERINVTVELGSTVDEPVTGGALDALEKLAKKIHEAEPALTPEMAFSKAVESNPKLYDQYLSEN